LFCVHLAICQDGTESDPNAIESAPIPAAMKSSPNEAVIEFGLQWAEHFQLHPPSNGRDKESKPSAMRQFHPIGCRSEIQHLPR
jgi:hypothetical protein